MTPRCWRAGAALILSYGVASAQGVAIPSSAARTTIDAERSVRALPEARSVMREPAPTSSLAEELRRGGVEPTADLLQARDPARVAAAIRALAARTPAAQAAPSGGAVTDLRQGAPSAAAIVDALRRK